MTKLSYGGPTALGRWALEPRPMSPEQVEELLTRLRQGVTRQSISGAIGARALWAGRREASGTLSDQADAQAHRRRPPEERGRIPFWNMPTQRQFIAARERKRGGKP